MTPGATCACGCGQPRPVSTGRVGRPSAYASDECRKRAIAAKNTEYVRRYRAAHPERARQQGREQKQRRRAARSS